VIDLVFNRSLSFRRRWKHLIYYSLRIFVVPMLRIVLRMRIYGLKNVPRTGGALLVSNHVHNADPVLIVSGCSRPVHFMAKAEVWDVPGARWVADQTGAFPVHRGTPDRTALRRADEVIKEGLLVGVFPEGTRSVDGLTTPFRGVSIIATHSGAPVIPVAITGTSDLPWNGSKQQKRKRLWPKVTLVFGEPFHLATHKPDGSRWSMQEHADAMMVEIAKVLPVSYRGIYADRVDEIHPVIKRDEIRWAGPDPKPLFGGWRRWPIRRRDEDRSDS
jgi:1-acyl-sn-glycerol-3-phosphate acyltransferase